METRDESMSEETEGKTLITSMEQSSAARATEVFLELRDMKTTELKHSLHKAVPVPSGVEDSLLPTVFSRSLSHNEDMMHGDVTG